MELEQQEARVVFSGTRQPLEVVAVEAGEEEVHPWEVEEDLEAGVEDNLIPDYFSLLLCIFSCHFTIYNDQ